MVVVQFEGMAMTAYDGYRCPKALRGSVGMISDPTQSGAVQCDGKRLKSKINTKRRAPGIGQWNGGQSVSGTAVPVSGRA